MDVMGDKKPKLSSFKDEEMRWLAENRAFLETTYPDMWIAIDGSALVGIGKTMQEAEDAAASNGVLDPLFDVVKSTAYQGKVLIR